MRKGINLSLTKSLFEFEKLLDRAIEAVQLKELSVEHNIYRINALKFSVGKYVQINYDNIEDIGIYKTFDAFWIGFGGWKENDKHKFCILLEFKNSLPFLSLGRCFTNAEELVGTSGKYYSKVECEYSHAHIKSCIRFYLKNKYLKQFYDENIDKNTQLEILTGFISEVVEKCRKKREQKENGSESVPFSDLFQKIYENREKYKQKDSEKGAFLNFSDIFGELFRNRDKGK